MMRSRSHWMALAIALLSPTSATADGEPLPSGLQNTALIRAVDPRTASVSERFATRVPSSGSADSVWIPDSTVFSVGSHEGTFGPVAPDGNGGRYVAWVGSRSIYGDVYLQRLDRNGRIAEGWPTGGLLVCRAENSQYHLALAPDGDDGVFVAWQDFRSAQQSQVYLQRITSAGVAAEGWPVDGLLVVTSDRDQYSPALTADGVGGALVAWQERREGRLEVRAMAVDPDGEPRPGWPHTGANLDRDGVRSDGIVLASIGSDAVVLWRSHDGFDVRVQARWIAGATLPDTATSSLTLAEGDAGSYLSEPALVADSAGFLAAWTHRSASAASVEVQRLPASGQHAAWPLAAIATPEGAGFLPPRLISDASGGALVVWEGLRNNAGMEIRAQRIAASGDTMAGWPTTGLAVTRPSQEIYGMDGVSDGAGGLIVSWTSSDSATLERLGSREAWPLRALRVREARATPGRARITWQTLEALPGHLLIAPCHQSPFGTAA